MGDEDSLEDEEAGVQRTPRPPMCLVHGPVSMRLAVGWQLGVGSW